MSITSLRFFIFVILTLFLYYITPKKHQWKTLLVINYVFYAFAGVKLFVFMLFTTISAYLTGRYMDSINVSTNEELERRKEELSREEKKQIRAESARRKKVFFVLTLVINFGILGVFKYCNNFISFINIISQKFSFSSPIPHLGLVLPLGISFYTFQAMGYIIDIYRGKYSSEKSLAKFALFVSFFPQLVQGPISRFDEVASQMFEGHKFDYIRVKHGFELFIWGLFKKLVIADRIGVIGNEIFNNYIQYPGLFVLIGAFCSLIQLYTDFSGGVDIMRGVAQGFGVILPNNFERPFFSKDLPEYWRRWHITLNTWLRDYVFYSLTFSKTFLNWTKKLRKFVSKKEAKLIPMFVAILIVRLINATWHGGGSQYFILGLYHGILICLGMQFEDLFRKVEKKFNINTKCFSWDLFRMIRTFTLVVLAKIITSATSLRTMVYMFKSLFTKFNPWILVDGSIFELGLSSKSVILLVFALLLLLVVSILQECGIHLREKLEEQNIWFQWSIILGGIFLILIFGLYGPGFSASEFIYQQF